jgi:hypothetical protein
VNVDFRKAFEFVRRNLVFGCLRQLGFSAQYRQLLEQVYAQAHVSFSVHEDLTQPISTDMGVLQGDPLSPTLSGVYIDCVIQHLRSECPEVVVRTVQREAGAWPAVCR